MIILFCSDKLEKLIGPLPESTPSSGRNRLGNWHGHVFILERKRNILFLHDKTAYAFVLLNVKKSSVKDLPAIFKESLIRQLYFDLSISERQEIKIRAWLDRIILGKTTERKQIRITIKDYVALIKDQASKKTLSRLRNVSIGWGLNNHFVGTRLKAGSKKYAIPKELMHQLIS